MQDSPAIALKSDVDNLNLITSDDDRLVKHLADLWSSHQGRELGVRHATGSLLNDRLGPPTVRQSRGKQVLRMVSKKLGVAMSDLSRMRWFANLFDSVEDLKEKEPGVNSWTTLKLRLPQLTAQRVGRKAARPSRRKGNAVQSAIRTLRQLTALIRRKDLRPEGKERKQMQNAVEKLLNSVASRLEFQVQLVTNESHAA